MLYFSKLKLVVIYFIIIFFSLFTFINFVENDDNFLLSKKVNLGLDLQGGSYLLLEVDSSPIINQNLQQKLIDIRKYLKKNKIKYQKLKFRNQSINFLLNDEDIEKFENFFLNKDNSINSYYNQYRSYQMDYSIEENMVIIKYSKFGLIEIKNSTLNQSLEIVRRRIDEVGTKDPTIIRRGKDSTRFMMLSRSNDVELDFDFEKVSEKSKDNPVFYVQYAYARINSIFRLLKLNLNKKIKLDNKEFDLNQHEIEILKKISEWPRCVEISSNKLEPHRIPFYLYQLVTLFHAYWNLGKDDKEFRFVPKNGILNVSRLVLLQALSIVIKNGMSILGVSTPSSM